ncbi:MAG: CHAD domain-containing protein [Propionivibrio sp.]
MPKEIELKLRLTSAQARHLAEQPALAGVKPQKFRLFNTYYDTPELDLCQRGIALRLRRKGPDIWLMTVKGGDPAAGALAQRSEWETPTQPGVFDFDIVTDAALRDFLKERQPALLPVFSTDFTRTAWTITRSGSVIEVALDRGRIDALSLEDKVTPLREPICELELELVNGDSPDALFEVAIELAANLHLHPAIASKAERGYALGKGMVEPPARSGPSQVDRRMSPGNAFRSIALDCLLQLQRNEAGAIAGKDSEYVHQARVAIRRLRSAFRTFAPALSPAFIEVYAPRWGELAQHLGSARDWDVFLAETLAPLEAAFPDDPDLARLRQRSEAVQAEAQACAGVALTRNVYSQLLLAFAAALFRTEAPTIESDRGGSSNLRKFAVRGLQKRAEKIRKIARKPASLGDMQRHRLRIAFKKLRYALEFFAPVLPRKRLKPYQEGLVAIQDLLGKLNDQVTAERLLKELHPMAEPDPLTSGWIAGRKHLLIEALNTELKSFLSLREPW